MNKIAEQMRAAWENPLATSHDPRHLLLLGAQEIDRLEQKVLALRDEVRHNDELSRHWEAKCVELQERLILAGY